MPKLKTRLKVFVNRLRLKFARLATTLAPNRNGLVSVIIPALESRADLLKNQCLPSISAQTYRNFEVVIASEVFSQEIANSVSAMGENYRYFWGAKKPKALKNAGSLANWCSGAAPNLNLAIAKSRGAFIARIDDDDEWLPDHLSSSVALLESGKYEFVSSRANAPEGGLVLNSHLDDHKYFGNEFEWLGLSSIIGPTITWVYKRHLRIFKFNPNSWKKTINRTGHYDFMFRIAAAGVLIGHSSKVSANYLSRPGAAGQVGHRAYLAEAGDVLAITPDEKRNVD